MLRGFYSAAAGMIAQQRRTEMLTNNMANATTPGFKADQSSLRAFPEMLLHRLDSTTIPTKRGFQLPTSQEIGSINTGVYMQEAIPAFIQGDLKETGNATDVALLEQNVPANSSIFFTVENSDGNSAYTRNGNFAINGEGFLTTSDGFYILDEAGNRIQLNSSNVKILEDGSILDNGTFRARINVAFAEDPNILIKEGNGLFRTDNNNPLPTAIGNQTVSYSIQQGFLERSNVDTAKTMTDLLSAYRAFEANQKILQAYDRSLEKAVTEVGRI